MYIYIFLFFSSRRRHTRFKCDWSSDVCSSDLAKYDNTAEPLTVEDMLNMYNQASGGSDPANVVVTGQTLYEKYNSLLQVNQRFSDSKMADAGFENLKFHGANVIWDEQAISEEMWFWPTKYLYLAAIPDHVKSFGVKQFEQM